MEEAGHVWALSEGVLLPTLYNFHGTDVSESMYESLGSVRSSALSALNALHTVCSTHLWL